jgi:hypothetical protein
MATATTSETMKTRLFQIRRKRFQRDNRSACRAIMKLSVMSSAKTEEAANPRSNAPA